MLFSSLWAANRDGLLLVYWTLVCSWLYYGSIICGSTRNLCIGLLDNALGAIQISLVQSLDVEANKLLFNYKRIRQAMQYVVNLKTNALNPTCNMKPGWIAFGLWSLEWNLIWRLYVLIWMCWRMAKSHIEEAIGYPQLGLVAESVVHWPCVQGIVGLNPGWVKPMTYNICYLLLPSQVLGIIRTSWLSVRIMSLSGTLSWCWQPDFPMRQHYKVAMSMRCHKLVSVLIWS